MRPSYTPVMFRTQRFAFQRNGPKRLSLRLRVNVLAGDWDEVEVRMDAVEVARTNRAELSQGVEYKLFDDSVLRMWLESAPSGPPILNITRNGHPLPGSGGDPVQNFKGMVILLWVFAGLQILAEALVIIPIDRGEHRLDALQTDYWVTAVGVIIVLLCIPAWQRSLWALIAACALFAGQLVLFLALHFYLRLLLTVAFPFVGMLWLMFRAIRSLIDLKSMSLPIRHPPE